MNKHELKKKAPANHYEVETDHSDCGLNVAHPPNCLDPLIPRHRSPPPPHHIQPRHTLRGSYPGLQCDTLGATHWKRLELEIWPLLEP